MAAENKFVKFTFTMDLVQSTNLRAFDLNHLKGLDALLRDASTTRAGGDASVRHNRRFQRRWGGFELPLVIPYQFATGRHCD